jgi:cell pole-organizing protein PopZ
VTAEPKDQQEPSMEEILSSIRRIIADEEAEERRSDEDLELGTAEAHAAADDDAIADDDDDDVLELTRVVRESGKVVDLKADAEGSGAGRHERRGGRRAAAPEPPTPPAAELGPEIELMPAEHESAGRIHASQEEDTTVPPKQAAAEGLLSHAAASAATGAFPRLSHAFQRTPAEDSVAEDSGRTVEQFVEDMIRPMVKDWMDENLPKIVERLVQKEIQKIARRAELL